MYKFSKLAVVLFTSTLATLASAQVVDNWRNGSNELVWKDGASSLCWRNAYWTPATANAGCDGALVVKAAMPQPKKVTPAAPAKVSLSAQANFASGKAALSAEDKAALDELARKLKGFSVDSVSIVGYTDSVGSEAANQKLAAARADVIKAYLVNAGVDAARVRTEAKSAANPVADNATEAGRAKNRRVEITAVGSKK